MKRKNFFFILIFIYSSLKIFLAEDFYNGNGVKPIYISDKIIYIINKSDNNQIMIFKNETKKFNYSSLIRNNKDIIKINDSDFIIIGLHNNNSICYQRCRFDDTNNIKTDELKCLDKMLNSNSKIDGRYIKDDKLLIYTQESNGFYSYLVNINNNPYIQNTVTINQNIGMSGYIKCDSFDGESFFCIYYYQDSGSLKMRYYYGNFNSNQNQGLSGEICSERCSFGNLIKVNDIIKKYLICYTRTLTEGSENNLICQYFYFENNQIKKEQETELLSEKKDELIKMPLNLYIYGNTLFIQYYYNSGFLFAMKIIIFPPDLKFIIHTQAIGSTTDGYNFLNLIINNASIFYIYEFTSTTSTTTTIEEKKLLNINNDTKIILSQNNSFSQGISFFGNNYVVFSWDENIELYNGNNYVNTKELLNLTTISTSTNFSIRKKNAIGFFHNYFCYINNNNKGNYEYFSLISKMDVTICYDLCNECIPEKEGNPENHLCTSCIKEYYPISTEYKNEGFNCYSRSDPFVNNYYLKDGKYYRCDESCKNCTDANNCISCNNNYYFKATKNDKIIPGLCFTGIDKKYYLNSSVNIVHMNVTNNIVYKDCYNSCLTCSGEGSYENNNCIECDEDNNYFAYAINTHQCLRDKDYYLKNLKYWEFKNNNIEPVDNCDKYIIIYEPNRGQCVDDCENFINPYLTTTMFFKLNNCSNFSYCIPLDKCIIGADKIQEKNKKFIIDYKNHTCIRTEECSIDIFREYDPFESDNIEIIETTIMPSTPIPIFTTVPTIPRKQKDMDDKRNEILTRAKITRSFNEDKDYSKFDTFDENLVEKYIALQKLITETSLKEDNYTGIFLINTINYNNFTINIYPLDIEEYFYKNIIIPNNLGFVNFTEIVPSFIEYEVNTSLYIIIVLLESKCENSSINDLNYYFFTYDEETDDSYKIDLLSNNSIEMNGDKLNIIYPLKNYINNNSKLSKRNTESLIENLNNMSKIELSNIDDPFFTDICELYTTEVKTDMTLRDRKEEFYVNESLCENNCTLNKVLDKDSKTIKALCQCDIKYNYSSNENAGKKFDIPHKSSYNIKAFICIKETFNSLNLSKNIIFWVLLIVIIFFIIMLLCYIFYGNKILKRIFKLGSNLDTSSDYNSIKINKNSEIKIVENDELRRKESSKKNDLIIIPKVEKEEKSLSKISKIEKQDSIPSNENLNIIMNNNNNNINNINNINNNNVISKFEISKLDQEKKLNPNSAIISDNNNEKIEIKKKEKNSYKYNPPKKKKEEKKNDSMLTKTNNEEKDLISSDISFSKNYKNKENNNSEISFENISREKPVLIDNLLNNGEMLENNYLDYPLRFENNLILEMYRDALDLYNDEVDSNEINQILHHFKTMEDYYIPESKEKEKLGKKKLLKRKNPRIIKLLDGEDLFYPGEKNYESDNYYEDDYHKKMNMNKKQYQESGEDTLLDNKLLIKNENKNIINKRTKNKNAKKDLIENSKQESENSEEKEIKLREKRKRKINFLQSLEKKDSSKKSDSKYGKEEDYKNARLKTDFEEDGKILVKSTLKYLGKEGLSSDENSSFSKNIKNKSFNSTINDKNNLFFSKNNLIIDDNLKPGKKHKILQLRDEEQTKKDKKNKKKKKQKRYIKNKKENSEIKESDEIKIDYNKASDFEIFYDKALGSSISSFMATGGDKAMIEENIFLYYWKYFKKRELFLVCFFDKKDTVPFFIRYSSLFFCLIFIFMVNCFFFFEKNVHKRYINALEGKSNDISFYFKNEFVNTIYVALISIVFKMIIVKLVLNRAFKIKKKDKKMMHRSYEKKISESEFDDLEEKRIDYLIKYHIRMIIFFVLLFILSLFFSYICVSYGGVFKNSTNYFFFGLLFSVILSFAFCAVICFIIVGINKIARCLKNRCLLSTYVVFSTAY